MKTDVVTFRLDSALSARLTALANRTHRTKAFYAREALDVHLQDLEDYYLGVEALAELRDSGPTETWGALSVEFAVDA